MRKQEILGRNQKERQGIISHDHEDRFYSGYNGNLLDGFKHGSSEIHLNFTKFTPANIQKIRVERSVKGLVQ